MALFLRSKKLDLETNDTLIAVIHKDDADEEGIVAGSTVNIIWDENAKGTALVIDTTSTLVKRGQIGLFSDFYKKFNIHDMEILQLELVSPRESIEYIREKMRGAKLSYEKIHTIVSDIATNRLNPVLTAYYVAAGYSPGFDEDEVMSMTKAMANTGEMFKFDGIVADKHSIGGVAGKGITPIVIPIISCIPDIIVPNTSSRAITSASATTDMLEVIMKMSFKKSELEEMIKKNRVFMVWGGGLDLAPADDHIIRVQKQLGIESIDKFVASIMAKKIAQGVNHVVFDIPIGPGAKISTEEEYKQVESAFNRVASHFGIEVVLHKRYVNSIDGHAVGPALECIEFLRIFEGDLIARERQLEEDAVAIAADLIALVKKIPTDEALRVAWKIFESGQAEQKLRSIIKAQGGAEDINSNDIEIGALHYECIADRSGEIASIDNKAVFDICKALGNPFIKEAGMYFHKFPKQRVNNGDRLFTLFATNQNRLDEAILMLRTHQIINYVV
ncbi:MAG: hypothetical protein WCO33_03110 [bacterium]